MRIHYFFLEAHLGFWMFLVFSVSVCYGIDKTVEVIGFGECADCAQNNIKSTQAFSGLRVTIDCKAANGELKTRGIGELEKDGKFKISLPQEDILENGDLKQQCYAQLHSASSKPCPTHNSLEDSKIVFNSKTDEKQAFTTVGKLKFSPVTCTSAFFWPHFKHPPIPKLPPLPQLPPFPKSHPWKHLFPCPPKSFPPIYKKPLPPPVPIFKKPLPPQVPVYEKPLPPPVPVYKKPLPPPVPVYEKPIPPPVPVYEKPIPPPVPIYKKPIPPPVPVYKKPLPPPVPIYKKPLPPPVPVYKKPIPPPVPVYEKPIPPPVPIYKKPLPPPVPVYEKPIPPPVPVYEKPIPPPVPVYEKPLPPPIFKPFPPFPKIPPIYKKPCPPIPKIPAIPTLPPFHKIPSKYFHHPKIGYLPPPYSPNPLRLVKDQSPPV